MRSLQFILVPVDGSGPSLAALDHALMLASDYDANIEVLHVVPPTTSLSPAAGLELERAMDSAVEHARSTLGPARVQRRTVTGDPVIEIVEAAQAGADLVVIGTHGRSGRLHSMLGSVTEGVVRNAPCPVLTVRDPGPGYESFTERRHGYTSVAGQPRPR